jgi:RNA polymerase sigma-70 factor (ECF subfamily)
MLYPLVISIVRNHLPRSEAEEDLTQEIFMKMFSRVKQFSGKQPFEHWVSRNPVISCPDCDTTEARCVAFQGNSPMLVR